MERTAKIARKTLETEIFLEIDLDGTGEYKIDSGVPFLDHMLTLFAVHSGFDLTVNAKGDIEVDYHHSVEDIGICLGKALFKALGDKKGIERYGYVVLPMEESLVEVCLDICNRPYLVFNAEFLRDKIGSFDTELIEEFMRAFCVNAGITLHINMRYGKNSHHIAEAIFKALARALKIAVKITNTKIPSSKGSL